MSYHCSWPPLRLALPGPSVDRQSLRVVGRREGSASYVGRSSWAGHDWRRQGYLQGRSAWRWRTLECERRWYLQIESLVPRAAMQAAVGHRGARRELSLCTREVDEALKEMLIPCWVMENSQVTLILKLTTTETAFLSVKSTAESQHARASIERARKYC